MQESLGRETTTTGKLKIVVLNINKQSFYFRDQMGREAGSPGSSKGMFSRSVPLDGPRTPVGRAQLANSVNSTPHPV